MKLSSVISCICLGALIAGCEPSVIEQPAVVTDTALVSPNGHQLATSAQELASEIEQGFALTGLELGGITVTDVTYLENVEASLAVTAYTTAQGGEGSVGISLRGPFEAPSNMSS